jgi:hypothetical protein
MEDQGSGMINVWIRIRDGKKFGSAPEIKTFRIRNIDTDTQDQKDIIYILIYKY